jgi:hypothetical protein
MENDAGVIQKQGAIRFASALRQGGPGVYVGFLGNEGPNRLRDAYPGSI